MLVDSHCHLDFPDFSSELDAVVGRARAAGVGRIVTISTRIKRHSDLIAIAERYDDVYCSIGTHPHNNAGNLIKGDSLGHACSQEHGQADHSLPAYDPGLNKGILIQAR